MAYELLPESGGFELLPESLPSKPLKMGADAFPDTLRSVLGETGWGTRQMIGMGTSVTNLWEGVKQLVGAEDKQKIQANKIIEQEAPIGSLAGNVALAAVPFGMVGNSVKGAAAVGAGLGALNPVEADNALDVVKGKLTQAALSGALSAGGQVVANKASSFLSDKAAQLAKDNQRTQPIRDTIKEAQAAGYAIPPGQVNPSFLNRRLESTSGKIATQQVFSEKNQAVTDALARKAASLSEDAPITPETLQAARNVIKKPYEDIAALGFQKHLDDLDALRAEANAAWREYSRQGTRAALNDYRNFSSQAKMLESQIDSNLRTLGKTDLMQKFREARVALAKNHDVEEALIEGGGQIDARAIGRMFQRGDKMTGELATIGKFANNFPKVVQPDKAMGTPDAHNLRHWMSLLSGGGGWAAGGPVGGLLAAGAVESLPYAARAAMFSKPVQQSLSLAPEMSPALRMGGGLLGYSPVGGAVFGLEALGQ